MWHFSKKKKKKKEPIYGYFEIFISSYLIFHSPQSLFFITPDRKHKYTMVYSKIVANSSRQLYLHFGVISWI